MPLPTCVIKKVVCRKCVDLNVFLQDCIYLAKEKFAKWLAAKDFESR